MKALIFVFVLCFFDGLMLRAEEASPGKAAVQSIAEFRKETKWEKRASRLTGGLRFYIQSAEATTALSCHRISWSVSNRYSVLTRIGTEGGRRQGARGQPLAKWNGNSIVAIWVAARWGMKDLAIYEIEADEIKQIQPVWRRVRLLFDAIFESVS